MPRFPRLQYENVIYHIVTRGDGRRRIFNDDRHYERFTEGLEAQVDRCEWRVTAYCWMPNHIHALIKTPLPNLCRGMQHWLSGYACLVCQTQPSQRTSFPGTLESISGRRFVIDGLVNPVDPTVDRLRDWVYGGEDFLKRMLVLAEGGDEVEVDFTFRLRSQLSGSRASSETTPVASAPRNLGQFSCAGASWEDRNTQAKRVSDGRIFLRTLLGVKIIRHVSEIQRHPLPGGTADDAKPYVACPV
jgi:REP element-mobilizing transposase RayT